MTTPSESTAPTEKMREEFENAVFNLRFRASIQRNPSPPHGFGGFDFVSVDCPTKAELCERNLEDEYVDETVSAMWWGWQAASRLAISAALPPLTDAELMAWAIEAALLAKNSAAQQTGMSDWALELFSDIAENKTFTAATAYESFGRVEQDSADSILRQLVALLEDEPMTRSPRRDEWCRTFETMLSRARAYVEAPQPEPKPIDMVLHCPKCGKQHIDKPEGQFYPGQTAEESADTNKVYGLWDNPPHRSHLCHACRHIWRPADVPTNGVVAVKTAGKADSPIRGELAQPAVLPKCGFCGGIGMIGTPGLLCRICSGTRCSPVVQPDAEQFEAWKEKADQLIEEYGWRLGCVAIGNGSSKLADANEAHANILRHLEQHPWRPA